jgi:hypothetical protein
MVSVTFSTIRQRSCRHFIQYDSNEKKSLRASADATRLFRRHRKTFPWSNPGGNLPIPLTVAVSWQPGLHCFHRSCFCESKSAVSPRPLSDEYWPV